MKRRVLNIGSLNMDMVIGMQYMPLEGETVLGDSLTYIPGGKGANQACAAAKLGGDVVMLGCVGEDSMGEALLGSLQECGADISHIRTVQEAPTGTAVIYVNARGDNSIVVVGGANNFCSVAYLQEHDLLFQQAEYIMLQMEIPYDAVFYAIRRASELKTSCSCCRCPSFSPGSYPNAAVSPLAVQSAGRSRWSSHSSSTSSAPISFSTCRTCSTLTMTASIIWSKTAEKSPYRRF